jgi:uncharacterized protein Yka (UPF0111/DUF47 family)
MPYLTRASKERIPWQLALKLSQQTQQQFKTFGSRLTETKHHLDQQLQHSKLVLNALHHKVGEIEHQIDAMSGKLKTQMEHLKMQTTHEQTEIDHEFHIVQEHFTKTSHQAHALTQQIEHLAVTASHELDGFHHLVETVKTNFDQHKTMLVQQLNTLETNAKQKSTVLVHDLTTLEDSNHQHWTEVQHTLDQATQDVSAELSLIFASEFPGELAHGEGAIQQAISALQSAGVSQMDALDGKFGHVLEEIEKFLHIFHDVKPVLETIAHFT